MIGILYTACLQQEVICCPLQQIEARETLQSVGATLQSVGATLIKCGCHTTKCGITLLSMGGTLVLVPYVVHSNK